MSGVEFAKGLEGVIAAETEICKIDGENGKLYYYGYSIEELAESSDFEEVSYLLLYEKLPNLKEMTEFRNTLREGRTLKPEIVNLVRDFPESAHPMELLQSVISYLSGYFDHQIHHSDSCNCRDTLHQIGQITTVIAAWARLHNEKEYIPPRKDLSHGANFLYMLRGEEPEEYEGAIMDKCLTLHAEHGFNASTFTARVVASTLSTCYCSISAAIGSLYGSLHGGANERVMDMVDEIGSKDRVRDWLDNALINKKKVMGMGHRVYKVKDPRAKVMEDFLIELSEKKGEPKYYEILKEIENVFKEKMEKKGKPIHPNVDFFSGAVYRLLDIPVILFTPLFAAARVSGWLAHILEQRKDNRIYRPKGLYQGQDPRPFENIDKRS